MCLPLMESEQEFLYQFFVRNVLPLNELNSKKFTVITETVLQPIGENVSESIYKR